MEKKKGRRVKTTIKKSIVQVAKGAKIIHQKATIINHIVQGPRQPGHVFSTRGDSYSHVISIPSQPLNAAKRDRA